MTAPDRKRLGEAVARRRTALGLGKEAAARRVPMSSITWKRVEDGLPVREVAYAGVANVLGWPRGMIDLLLYGEAELPDDTPVPTHGPDGQPLFVFSGVRDGEPITIGLPEPIDAATQQDMLDAMAAIYRASRRS